MICQESTLAIKDYSIFYLVVLLDARFIIARTLLTYRVANGNVKRGLSNQLMTTKVLILKSLAR